MVGLTPFIAANLALAILFTEKGNALASESEIQSESLSILDVKKIFSRASTSIAALSMLAAVAAMIFVMFKCFATLKSYGRSKAVPRRLAVAPEDSCKVCILLEELMRHAKARGTGGYRSFL
ncbi:hypothetical protein, conserved [Eimeria tenella]|uniref:Uncharacterized protein n=1 Tax=Eimeria tenella TaxID=5802 RepID=U6KZG5_EIMTE|nr:hypothetical protein, conserved [Eimeria tenella]CDJ41719.1 hypothetical protein, conserved [Eimeria tenella]|eukprot:XP_013232469.1 hypothetical protein, conserved [Eimeria tenella]